MTWWNAATNFGQTVIDVFKPPSSDTERYIRPTVKNERLAAALKKKVHDEFSTPHGEKEGLEIRKIKMKIDDENLIHKVQKCSLGNKTNKPNKIIMLVGATGTGKTTLINNMVNFIYRVYFDDNFRFILIDDKEGPKISEAFSQTDIITAYSFNHIEGMPFEFNYVLIDTPGFGDTRGIARDREMMTQLEEFLKEKYGVDSVDAIGFVTPAAAARLTKTQLYVFDGLLSMFGKNIVDNIYVIATFADAKRPPVLEALDVAEIQYKGFYKFNNSALYANNKLSTTGDEESDTERKICTLYWDMGYKNMREFFIKLSSITPVSLSLTKEVLKERNSLQIAVIGLQSQINIGMGRLSVLEEEQRMLDRMNDEIGGTENFEQWIDVPKITKINLDPGEYVTNCVKCNFTCHYPCYLKPDISKERCYAMTHGHCRVCVTNCKWSFHENMTFRIEHNIIKEKRTLEQLKQRYNQAKGGQASKECMIKSIEEEIEESTILILATIKMAQRNVERLEEIALKPNPLSTTEYIDLMIQSEKMQRKTDYQRRINILERLKQESSILHGITNQDLENKSGKELIKVFKDMMITGGEQELGT